jgi:uncharacterized membrane protein YsdA (DUF1294 family)
MPSTIVIYLVGVLVMSGVTFAAYGWDKRQAVAGGRRLPERTLHLLAFLGGWPGAWMGQRRFRHKTKKLSFLIVFWCVAVLHVAIVGSVAYVVYGSPFAEARAAIGR